MIKMLSVAAIVAILIAMIMKMLPEAVFFLFTFIPLRQNAGGYHTRHRITCAIMSVFIYIFVLIIIKNFEFNALMQIFLCFIDSLIILCFAPVENENNELDDKDKQIYKMRTLNILILESLAFSILFIGNSTVLEWYNNYVCNSCNNVVEHWETAEYYNEYNVNCMRYRIWNLMMMRYQSCSEIETCIQQRFRNKSDSVEVFVWNSAESFINDVPEKTDLDILFLDIELPEKNGVDVGYYIRESMMNVGMHIIYISSKTSYALDLFDIHPYNFFVKPLSCEKICSEIEKLLQLDRQDKRFFTYIYNKSQYKVLYGNIIYLKSDKHQINIICSDSEKRYVGKLKQELNRLPVYFVMVNQSIVVNIRHIKEFLLNEIVMDNGDYIAISKNYRKSFNMQILDLQMEQDNI